MFCLTFGMNPLKTKWLPQPFKKNWHGGSVGHFFRYFLIDGQSLRLRGPAINWWLFFNRRRLMILVSAIGFSYTHHLVALSRNHFRQFRFQKPKWRPSGGHFVCIMTVILVYRSKSMFASHRGVYMKILHGCYQNHESASLLLTIILIFGFLQCLMYFQPHTMSGIGLPENPTMVDIKIMLFCPFCQKSW